jgi:hypothetical protein
MSNKKSNMNDHQFTKEQALAFYKSDVWKDWTHEQIVRLQMFQKCLCVDFSYFHECVEKVLGRPVFTHEFAYLDRLIQEYLGAKEAPSFEEIINLIPEEKRILIRL